MCWTSVCKECIHKSTRIHIYIYTCMYSYMYVYVCIHLYFALFVCFTCRGREVCERESDYKWCRAWCVQETRVHCTPSTSMSLSTSMSRVQDYKLCCALCRISSLLQGSFAKETDHFIDPTKRSHLICLVYTQGAVQRVVLCVQETLDVDGDPPVKSPLRGGGGGV